MNSAILAAKRRMELNPSPYNINNYLWLVHLHRAYQAPAQTSQSQHTL
jgi:hypothetical protein